jgi:Xaa-Pro aminopeptidase
MRNVDSFHGFLARQERLRALMESRRISTLLLTNLTNIRYLTGFSGSAGVAVVSACQGILWVDPRYTLQAREEAHGVEVLEEKGGLLKAAAGWLRTNRVREAAFEVAQVTCADFDQLARETRSRVKFRPGGELVEALRVVKDREEIGAIRRAGALTAEVFEEILRHVRPSVREADLAAEIEYRMRKKGADGVAFETIVASGRRGALPHARATSKSLQQGELVIFDLGAILSGYAADMTRTVFLGDPGRPVRRLYKAVVQAQRGAVQAIRAGRKAADVDAIARRNLAEHGLDRYFIHSTGHGVGLEIHEKPRLARSEKGRLRAGCVVTVEPGVYLEGLGGVRVEDTVLVGPEGAEILTPASKERWVIS